MLSIRTNTSTLSALNALGKTNVGLSVSQTRLSTGYRINSARDDAAGLQIAIRLESQSHGMSVAMRNTQNAVSMMQTADSLFSELGSILIRMSELVISAADASSTQDDRDAMHDEYVGLSEQVLNITNESTYAGKHLFRYVVAPPGPNGPGTMGSGPLTFQIGSSSAETATEDFRPGLGRLNSSLYYAINNGNLHNQPLDGPGTELTSSGSANALIDKLAEASADVSALRAQFGAFGNRLDSVHRNLSNMHINTEIARGRIVDVDFATETAAVTKHQMLVQSSIAMVKQSNSISQLAMSMLQ